MKQALQANTPLHGADTWYSTVNISLDTLQVISGTILQVR